MLTSRRKFLQSAGALALAPYCVPRAALGSRTRRAASERITLGIIGLKKMGREHVRHLLDRGDVQIVAVCDVDSAARETQRLRVQQHYAAQRRDGRYTGCEAYNEYERILERPDIDAVVIAVPDHWHALISIAAARAGKHVYCEKPLSLTIREGRAMVRAVRRYGVVFQTGSQQRSERNFRLACELVRSGYIGQVRRVHVGIGPPSQHILLPAEPVPPGFDYDRWLGPAPWAPYNRLRCGSYYDDGWRRIRDYSGGKMTDWGAHYFDIVQWGLGMDDGGPVEIIPPPLGGREPLVMPVQRDGSGASPDDPTRGLTFRYASGVEVIKDTTSGVRFVGTEGEVHVDRGQLKAQPQSLARRLALPEPLGPDDVHLYESPGHHADWLNCIRTGRRPICDVEIGCRSATVCHLGNIALWLKRPIRWDPVGEQIIGDEYAARWLDRPKRAPYRLPV